MSGPATARELEGIGRRIAESSLRLGLLTHRERLTAETASTLGSIGASLNDCARELGTVGERQAQSEWTATLVRSPHARALALLYEAYVLLGDLYDLASNGPHSSLERAWDACDDAIEALEGPSMLPRLIVAERQEVRHVG